jgi:hypothetical protein
LILAQKLRNKSEREEVGRIITKHTKIQINIDAYLESTWEKIKEMFSFNEEVLRENGLG